MVRIGNARYLTYSPTLGEAIDRRKLRMLRRGGDDDAGVGCLDCS